MKLRNLLITIIQFLLQIKFTFWHSHLCVWCNVKWSHSKLDPFASHQCPNCSEEYRNIYSTMCIRLNRMHYFNKLRKLKRNNISKFFVYKYKIIQYNLS